MEVDKIKGPKSSKSNILYAAMIQEHGVHRTQRIAILTTKDLGKAPIFYQYVCYLLYSDLLLTDSR